jgi:molybdenum cofactor cytidylyltransferase
VRVVGVLLAAGLSTRFGEADKMATPLGGVPLAEHAARALAALPLSARLVVTRNDRLAWHGLRILPNLRPDLGLSHSLKIGLAGARAGGADAILVALADMPFVPIDHFQQLLALATSPDCLLASGTGTAAMPPVVIGSDWFAQVEAMEGDQGARPLLRRARIIACPPQGLRDIDYPEDLPAPSRAGRPAAP